MFFMFTTTVYPMNFIGLPDFESLIRQFAKELAYHETSNVYLGYRVATVNLIVCYPAPPGIISPCGCVFVSYLHPPINAQFL